MYRALMELQLLWLEIRAALAFRSWEAAHNRALYHDSVADLAEREANEARREYESRARSVKMHTMMHERVR